MSEDRSWMYNRFREDRRLNNDHIYGVNRFLEHAWRHARSVNQSDIRCPCNKCRNVYFLRKNVVEMHLYKYGFVRGYEVWEYHGETDLETKDAEQAIRATVLPEVNTITSEYVDMVNDGFMGGLEFDRIETSGRVDTQNIVEDPNPLAAAYYKLLESTNEPLFDGCSEFTKVSMASELLNLKAESDISQAKYERWVSVMRRLTPNKGATIPIDFYEVKKMLGPLFLPKQKIHACVNNCMLFYKENECLQRCSTCGEERYKPRKPRQYKPIPRKILTYLPLAPRLQRLYMSRKTANDMIWHSSTRATEGWMNHPRDGGAWKHFDSSYPNFASEPRNVRIGLCTDGFQTVGGKFGGQYSCWPVMICVYNLPPGLCMKDPYILLTLILPGPDSPGRDIDVYLRPLIYELKSLWEVGIVTYDAAKQQNFNMRVSLMWTISDFPAYGMLSGWSTHGRLSCPYCMNSTYAFYLKEGKKHSWFDCHRCFLPPDHQYRSSKTTFYKGRMCDIRQRERLDGDQIYAAVCTLDPDIFGELYSDKKYRTPGYGDTHNWTKKSIFWELPYWSTQKIRHNIDFMHTEKNNGDNELNTIMDIPGKTKDNDRARLDIATHCSRPSMHLQQVNGKLFKPKANYTLTKAQQKDVRGWLCSLKFPDGYASNISRSAKQANLTGLKSHDVHILVQRLIPVMTRHLLPNPIWDTITELSHFFRDLSSTTLNVDHVKQLEKNIVEIICKMEKIFPPAYFDVMEHLPVYLPYEALHGGPVQYRWMYPFESYLGKLKKMVRQKARVEGSICEAYLVNEVSNFCSMYFEESVQTNLNKPNRHDVEVETENDGRLPIFQYPGRPTSTIKTRFYMKETECRTAHVYILSNTPEVENLLIEFNELLVELHPEYSDTDRATEVNKRFGRWLENYVEQSTNNVDQRLCSLSSGPRTEIKRFKGYYVNGYYFDTNQGSGNMRTYNSGVCVKGSSCNDKDHVDYYGVLEEIWELSYGGGQDKIVLFKCYWFDIQSCMRVHPRNGVVEIKHKSRGSKDDPFILASQAQQVYYLRYVSKAQDHKQWHVAVKTKARSRIDSSHIEFVDSDDNIMPDDVFQEEEQPEPHRVEPTTDLDNIDNFINVGEDRFEGDDDDDEAEFEDEAMFEGDDDDDDDDDDEAMFEDGDDEAEFEDKDDE